MNVHSFTAGLILIIVIVIAGCETPADSFDRGNINDPASPVFAGGSVTGLRVEAGAGGNIRLQWPAPDDIVDKHIIEKSLGDSLSFTTIAELEAGVLQYVDSTRDVRKETYYRLSSYIDLEDEDDVLYGRTKTGLTFGEITNEEFEFLEESNRLQLSWKVDVPFYTHFVISSENVISDQQENTVRIAAGTIENVFEDPLADINFETRNYTIKGIIENDGIDEVVTEKDVIFNAAAFFKPRNVEINILNEQDWEVSWEGDAFFATGVELIRVTNDEDYDFQLSAETNSYTDSLILDDFQDSRINQFRRYLLRFVNENGKSEAIEKFDDIDIVQPVIAVSNIPQHDPNSLIIYGAGFGEDKDLIKGYIIEIPHPIIPDRFVEVGRADGGRNFQFTDSNVNGSDSPVYRVRTLTSYPSETATFTYSHDYDLDYEFDTGMNYVTSMEVSSGKKYLAAVSFRSEYGNSILITDIESRQTISEIRIPSEQITDIKISSDEEILYFAVPSDRAIYKADFPGGENIEKIIDDANVNAEAVFNIDVSFDNSFIVGTGGRGFVKKWSLETYEAAFVFAEYSTPTFYLYKNITISPDGNQILVNNGRPIIIDANDASIIETLPWVDQNVTDHQFSSDGNYLSFVSGFSSPHIFSTVNMERTDLFGRGRRADFHPEENRLVISGRHSVYTFDLESLSIVDVISGDNGSRPYHRMENKITYLDNDRVVTVSGAGSIQIWEKNENQRRWKNVIYQ